ncbi:hypothetical protein V1512DRAFT_253674 [Lipomyces arxii]|uniref:uncharacterized protein n=1 Tax=Lipomyces arxii TaxID=56418 RepID=UPI0034CEB531
MSKLEAGKGQTLNDLLRLLTANCKIPLSIGLPVASVLLKNGLLSKESIGLKSIDELKAICPTLTDQQLQKLHSVCASSPRKRKSAAATDGLPKRGRKFIVKDEQAPIDDSALELPILLDEDVIIRSSAAVNRAPLMILFAYTILKHTYPDYGAGSYLSLASATASSASRVKAKAIGLSQAESGLAVDLEKILQGYRTLQTFGSIEVPVLRRGDHSGYWGLDVDAMEKQAEKGVVDPEMKWIHPAQVNAYLFRAFGNKNLAAVHGAIELVIQSWENDESWPGRAWSWYIKVRPDVAYGREGWGQKGTLSCQAILNLKRTVDEIF